MPLFEAFYMTIITISTVGFSEIRPLTAAGRSITLIIIVLGISVGTYTIGIIVRWFVEGELSKIFRRRKLHKQMADLKNHFIICGFGRIGRIICQELYEDNIDFVIIEQDASVIEDIAAEKLAFAFGAPVILNANLRDGSLRQAVEEQGIPMLLYEAGEALRFDEFAVRAGVKGILSVYTFHRHVDVQIGQSVSHSADGGQLHQMGPGAGKRYTAHPDSPGR